MNAEQILSLITAISTVVLSVITWHYARGTHRMLRAMKRQARIQAISAELSVLNLGQASRSGSASAERANKLIEDLQLLVKE
jgi:uncharacterized membrane-anchored protein